MNKYETLLEIASHWAAILTAVVALVAYLQYTGGRLKKRWRLESYLKPEKASGQDAGQRTLLHLTAELGMTEAEIVDAAFRSKLIRRRVRPDQYGLAAALLLEYDDKSG
jgi:hypothetical protein